MVNVKRGLIFLKTQKSRNNYQKFMKLRFEYRGITPLFEPFLTTFEIVEVDNNKQLLHCRSNDGVEKSMTFHIFNLYMKNGQLKLI